MKNLKLFSGTSNVPLAEKIAENLFTKLGDIYHHRFPSGETYCQFKENIRGSDVFLIQGITNPANENLMELLVMADAARRASAERITAVIPYFGYARQDRKDKSRVPISAKLVLDIIETAGIDRVVTMDLHSPQVGGFTNLPFDHLTFEPVLVNYIRSKYHGLALRDSVVLMAPDVGAVKRIEKYASILKSDFGFISKKRIGDDKVELQSIVGDVKDKHVIIIDDLTESCGTLIQAADACKNNGAKYVTTVVTHGCITETGVNRLENALVNKNIDEFVYSNTANIAKHTKLADRIVELDVSMVFAKAINNIHNNESVSELFI
jgi:ribose-phosphate pyrophosphokinase